MRMSNFPNNENSFELFPWLMHHQPCKPNHLTKEANLIAARVLNAFMFLFHHAFCSLICQLSAPFAFCPGVECKFCCALVEWLIHLLTTFLSFIVHFVHWFASYQCRSHLSWCLNAIFVVLLLDNSAKSCIIYCWSLLAFLLDEFATIKQSYSTCTVLYKPANSKYAK